MLAKKSLGAAPAAEALYVEDVFSTYLYSGQSSGTITIDNGIDLSGEGGLVWIKQRNGTSGHQLCDTERGITNRLQTNTTGAQSSEAFLGSVTSTGFTLPANYGDVSGSTGTYASWTFRKAKKFFDVVTYTGNGNAGRAISHNLGSTPGFIIIKRTDSTSNWFTAHRSVSGQGVALNSTDGVDGTYYALNTNSSDATSTTVTVSATRTNVNGASYVMYLFAHDAGGFGDDGDQSVISCGSWTGNGNAAGPTVNLGWEPQWILWKRATDGTESWHIRDNMRGMPVSASGKDLYANLSSAEGSTTGEGPAPNATGFQIIGTNTNANTSGKTYIYIAIRRGPMKTPEAGTEVFSPLKGASTTPGFITGWPVDTLILGYSPGFSGYPVWGARLTGDQVLTSSSTAAQTTNAYYKWDFMNGSLNLAVGSDYVGWNFRRAPGFFDVVCYTGTGSTRTLTHNLGAVPELIIVKDRSQALDWAVYAAPMGNDKRLLLNTTAIMSTVSWWDNTTPTSTTFKVSSASLVNGSGDDFVAYLFGSLSGISKVGSYSGTGTTQQIDCGFTNGARFVLIKRTDSTANWFLWDSARGIVSGNDPYLLLNDTAAEVTNTDYIDTYSAGFELSSTAIGSINGTGGTFIYLAIA